MPLNSLLVPTSICTERWAAANLASASIRILRGVAMLSERDIYATANVMMRRYGDDAAMEAAQRADKLMADGDMHGATVWRRVASAIEELAREVPRRDEAVH
jgi:hypothetical protein